MAFNGAGTFVRVHDWTSDADAAINIRADRMDEEFDGMATGLSNCVTKDGQSTITANLPMAGFRHTGVGEPTARTQYATVAGLQDGKWIWVDGGGTSDAITATYSPALTALVDGQLCFVRATAANTTATPTFSPNALTARTIVKNGGVALVAGDIRGDGHQLILRYDLANTGWELLNPASPVTITNGIQIGTASNVTEAAPNLTIAGNGYNGLHWLDANAYYIGQNSASRSLRMYSGASATTGVELTNGATSWASTSDERLKDILEPMPSDALSKVAGLRSVIGRYKTDSEEIRRSFLIAQDVQAVLPEAVTADADGFLSLRYTDVIPLLVAALKEASDRLAALEAAH